MSEPHPIRPSRRQQIAPIAHRLREIRDDIERINDPYDPELGMLHARVAVIVNELRGLAGPGVCHGQIADTLRAVAGDGQSA